LKVLIYLGVLVALTAAAFLGVFGDLDLDAPDADQQEKTATACLHAAGLGVKSDIPSYRGYATPEYVLDVSGKEGEDDHVAFVFLFDDADTANDYLERAKNYAEDDPPPKSLTIERRGAAVLRIFGDDPEAAAIRACIDKAGKPPPDKK
jgi:hypothetical protein